MKRLLILFVSVCGWASFAQASESSGFQARVGMGSTFEPQVFLMSGTLEYRVDPFFAFGPTVMYGVGSITDYFVPTMGARLILPKEYFGDDRSFPGVDIFLQAGVGAAWRETNGFRKKDFTFQSGIGADVFLTPLFCLGVQGNVNFVGEDVEESFFSLLGTAGIRF